MRSTSHCVFSLWIAKKLWLAKSGFNGFEVWWHPFVLSKWGWRALFMRLSVSPFMSKIDPDGSDCQSLSIDLLHWGSMEWVIERGLCRSGIRFLVVEFCDLKKFWIVETVYKIVLTMCTETMCVAVVFWNNAERFSNRCTTTRKFRVGKKWKKVEKTIWARDSYWGWEF